MRQIANNVYIPVLKDLVEEGKEVSMMISAELQIYCGRIGVRVVSTNLLNKFTITWCSYVCNNDRVESIAFTSMSLQSDFCCHLNKCF